MNYVYTVRELRSLHAVLKEWVRLNQLLGRQWSKEGNDLPWWYNERALLSLFAGAVWNTGGHAFEEFSEIKHKSKRRRKGNGRVDLWFKTSGGEFRAEAKDTEIPITNRSQQQKSLHALMKRAVADARRNPADGFSRRLAIAIAVPYMRAGLGAKKQQEQISWFLSLFDEVDYDAVAWSFPPLKKLPIFNDWVCPGIVIMIKLVKRSP